MGMGNQITYNSEKIAKKKVVLTNNTGASLTIRGGYAVCYDQSQTDISQAYSVLRPATANLGYFAGVITEEYDGKIVANGATINIEIYIPTKYGQVVPVWISEDHSANVALLEPTNGTFVLLEGSTTKVAQTVGQDNRSVTNGTTLARLYGISDPLA
ncbi:hypothetical protein [Neptuniibacter sp.]|uniref:hypothetical protein n=1 Tax=Neptuniibacter sp. TaxID=1962643 RepID=UPI0026299878|nr:hypothetical protein [Neptuniibacter sp.]MCP4598513.1 hypothetical protein [Neptuniibacter sp.]